jgi:hypothetical protein
MREIFDQATVILRDLTLGLVRLRYYRSCPECGHRSEVSGKVPDIKASDILKAIEIAGRFGMGEAKAYDDVLIGKLAMAVRDRFGDDDPRVRELAEDWKLLIAEHLA